MKAKTVLIIRNWLLALCVLIGLIGLILIVTKYKSVEAQNQALQSQIQADSGRVWKGEYTIFNYTQNGWTNRLYVTEFYIEDDTIYYKLREQEEYLPVKFDNCLPAVGWVEDIDKLMKYGFWESGGYD